MFDVYVLGENCFSFEKLESRFFIGVWGNEAKRELLCKRRAPQAPAEACVALEGPGRQTRMAARGAYMTVTAGRKKGEGSEAT